MLLRGPPPPINYATCPKHSALTSGGSQAASTTLQPTSRVAPPTPSTNVSTPGSANVRTPNAEWLANIIHLNPIPPAPHVTEVATMTSSTMDGRNPANIMDGRDPAIDTLADTFDGLSTSNPAQPPAAPFIPASVIPSTPRRHGKTRYYAVIVGKRCGVFNSWSTVHPLVIGVPGSLYTGFLSYDDAATDYYAAKAAGQVKAVRDPGDEYIYGPLSSACM